MQESLYVTGIVLKQTPFGEYDRIVSLLTREKGKITAFARGARKPGNRLAAATNPFAFGTFRLYEGRTSYTISEADIQNFFPEQAVKQNRSAAHGGSTSRWWSVSYHLKPHLWKYFSRFPVCQRAGLRSRWAARCQAWMAVYWGTRYTLPRVRIFWVRSASSTYMK